MVLGDSASLKRSHQVARHRDVRRSPNVTGPRDLSVKAHAFHDQLHAVRFRIAYSIKQAPGVDCRVNGLVEESEF